MNQSHPEHLSLPQLLPPSESGRTERRVAVNLDARQFAGFLFLVAAFIFFFVGWWGISGTSEVSRQLPYLLSGGLGGAGLLLVGALLFTAYEHASDRSAILRLETRLEEMEQKLIQTCATAIEQALDGGAANSYASAENSHIPTLSEVPGNRGK